MAFISRGRTPGGQFAPGIERVEWNGANVLMRVTEASLAAVQAATDAAAEHARANHPWQGRSGDEERSIRSHPAVVRGTEAIGSWGADFPAPFLEFGTSKMPAYPFLRPAADATYRRHMIFRV